MTNQEINVLVYVTKVANAIESNNMEEAIALTEEINAQNFTSLELASISDSLVVNTYSHVTEVHYYFLKNIKNLPDSQALIRVAQAKRTFNLTPAERRSFLEEVVNSDIMITGHTTDFYFCSMLIRLCLSVQAFDLIDEIQKILKESKTPEGV